jgi:rod shape-determining protein MreD
MASAELPPRVLLPVRPAFVAFSLAVALVLELAPWGSRVWVPDFVALVLAFWCTQQPRLVGVTVAWLLGLVVDVAHGTLFGQHALAYALLGFASVALRRRLQRFSRPLQALHVLPILLSAQLCVVLIRLLAGASFPGWSFFIASFVGAALWMPVSLMLLAPQRRPPDPDENHPI